MDSISVSHYTLQGKAKRSGALLKVRFADRLIGYGDCHPWEELGDIPLQQQLANLRERRLSSQLKRTFHYARIDAEARARGEYLLDLAKIPLSHHLVDSEQLDVKYSVMKIKIGNDPIKEVAALNSLIDKPVILRLDCNEKMSADQYHHFIEKISKLHSQIDFVEDPYPFDPEKWTNTRNTYSIPLACDRNINYAIKFPEAYDVAIWKPAIEDKPNIGKGKRLVVTSYLDHPIGQCAAIYEAVRLETDEICGLMSHSYYERNSFSEELLKGGTGFGFDRLLEKVQWVDV